MVISETVQIETQFLRFRAGNRVWMLPLSDVLGLDARPVITPVPLSSPRIIGVYNSLGGIWPLLRVTDDPAPPAGRIPSAGPEVEFAVRMRSGLVDFALAVDEVEAVAGDSSAAEGVPSLDLEAFVGELLVPDTASLGAAV